MKLTRDTLKKIIKEELEEMMGQEAAQEPQATGDIILGNELKELAGQLGVGLSVIGDFMKLAAKGQPVPTRDEQVKKRLMSLAGRYNLGQNPNAEQYIMASIAKAAPPKQMQETKKRK
jgi:hypothetical protein